MVSGFDSARWAEAIAANAAILRDIAARRGDISGSRLVDFAHIFRDFEAASAFADEAAREGYAVEISQYGDEDFPWDVRASREMAPTAETITKAEVDLSYYAIMHGGRADGWGFYSPDPILPGAAPS